MQRQRDDTGNFLMLAITSNIDSKAPDQGPCKLAIKAFLHTVPYTQVNFETPNERDFILQKVFEVKFGHHFYRYKN